MVTRYSMPRRSLRRRAPPARRARRANEFGFASTSVATVTPGVASQVKSSSNTDESSTVLAIPDREANHELAATDRRLGPQLGSRAGFDISVSDVVSAFQRFSVSAQQF
jgi:hypothetical protein